MIKYLNCDCINSKCKCIVNQINLSGNMDLYSGLEFSIRFPKMYNDYLSKFSEDKLVLYSSYAYEENEHKIINMACYESYAFPTTLETIEKCLAYFVKHYKEFKITEIAFPLLGCDEDGLRMVNVLPIMEKYLKPLPIDCYICFDIDGPSNLEEQMVLAFKEADMKHLQEYAKLNDIQIASLNDVKESVYRFEEIYYVSGIDVDAYRHIYNYFYEGEYKKLSPFYQEELF